MKKYTIILAVLLGSVVSSCDLDSPSKSSLDSLTIAQIYELAEYTVMGIYQSFGETNSYRGRFIPYYGMNTDIEWINSNDGSKMPDESKYDLCTYAATPTNTQMNNATNAYAKFYEGIERANIVIESIRELDAKEDARMNQLLGEVLTLRAVFYLDLIKGWGDVPARFKPLTTETMYLGRSDRDVIYKQLLADLEEAAKYCAWPNETTITSTTERVNKAFVKGLRARIALYAGGYAQRADGIRRSNDPDLSPEKMYAIAKKECLDVYNDAPNELGSFKENFFKLSTDDVTAGGESLWEIPFDETRGRVMYTFGIKHQAKDQYTQQAQGGVNGPVPTLFYDYDVDDIRRDITCAPYRWSNSPKSVQEPWAVRSWCFGKLRYEWTATKRIVTNEQDDGINWQYMRLADVYMMAAEAVNEIDGPNEAWKYMEPILSRALPEAKVTVLKTQYTASKEAFFQGIVEQRAFEFAGEMLRKADLIRWNMLKTKLDETKAKLNDLRNQAGKYADLPSKLYYTYEADGETLKIYGLNHGDTDAEGARLVSDEGYQQMDWIGKSKISDGYIKGVYSPESDPDKNQYWPLWKTFVDASNGMLDNNWFK